MSIINQKYENIIQNSLKHALASTMSSEPTNHYVDFIGRLDRFLLHAVLESIRMTFERIDLAFKESPWRKELYYVKGRHARTILTLFGEVRFEREYYVPKDGSGPGFFYVDTLFSLPKRDYFDPMIKATIVEYSAAYSYTQVGELVCDKIGERFQTLDHRRLFRISRQTVHHIIKQADLDVPVEPRQDVVDTIHIQLDEKWVATQGTDGRKTEIKAAVVYTGIEREYSGRNRLVNRHVITSDQSASHLRERLLDHILHTFDIRHVHHIILSGDGANWIKNTQFDLAFPEDVKTVFVLDRFHLERAIHHISSDPDIKQLLRSYITLPRTKAFRQLCDALIETSPERTDVMLQAKDYILSNWKFIQHQRHPKFLGCSMEGHISHVLAALFTSRPKAHSRSTLTKRLRIRELFVNGVDIKATYLSNQRDPVPIIDHLELLQPSPKGLFDIIGHRTTQRYKDYKHMAHPTFI